MRGEAIHDIGSQVLVKFVLADCQKFLSEVYKQELGTSLSKELREHV